MRVSILKFWGNLPTEGQIKNQLDLIHFLHQLFTFKWVAERRTRLVPHHEETWLALALANWSTLYDQPRLICDAFRALQSSKQRKKQQQPLSVSVSAAVVLGVARIRVLPGLTRSSSQGQNPKPCSDLTDWLTLPVLGLQSAVCSLQRTFSEGITRIKCAGIMIRRTPLLSHARLILALKICNNVL